MLETTLDCWGGSAKSVGFLIKFPLRTLEQGTLWREENISLGTTSLLYSMAWTRTSVIDSSGRDRPPSSP